MKVLPYSEFGRYPKEIQPLLEKFHLQITYENPEVVITFGGDGTLIGAERDYPGIPKLPLKHSEVGNHTIPLEAEETLKLLVKKKLPLKEFPKLEIEFKGEKFLALNDVVIRNSLPNTALRFHVSTSNEFSLSSEGQLATGNSVLIGDGLVIATPFGSSGYFYSITRQTFEEGIGLAFNNIHNINAQHQILKENSKLTVTVDRGPGIFAIDNNPSLFTLSDGDSIVVSKSSKFAKIFSYER